MLHLFIILGLVYCRNQTQNDTIRIQTPEYEQNLNNSRNIFYSCIITTYSYLTSKDEIVQNQLDTIMEAFSTIEAPEIKFQSQQLAWKRIQIDAVKHCTNKQTIKAAQKMYDELQSGQLNVTNYYSLMNGFQLPKYYNSTIELDFEDDEETLWQIIEDFQEKSRQHAGAFDEMEDFQYIPEYMANPYDTMVFGQPIEKSSSISIIIFASVFIVFGVIMIVGIDIYYVAYNALKDSHKVEQKKKKKRN